MTAPENTPLADPLARRRVVVSGPHLVRILLVSGAVFGVGITAYMIGRGQGDGGTGKQPILFDQRLPDGKLPSYADLAPPPPPATRVEVPKPSPTAVKPTVRGPVKEDELWKKAMEAGVGGWSRKEPDKAAVGGASTGSEFASASGDCVVPAGTPIPLQTISRVVTERGGLLTAQVTRDVWDAGFACLAVPAGSMMTMEVGTSTTKGQKRIAVAKPVITRPWPRNDTVHVAAIGSDATGAAGLAGSVEVPWFQTGLLIAASTAVDTGVAALTGGSLIGGILGHNIDRPLDKAAKGLLDQAPVITLDPGELMILLLQGSIRVDDFRN
ncbi:TrbI/VirB10 family protein [Azospirillum sp. A29]|uniref:TrbI/VirB10 family protein n=1 Tax=Azospirillum sp. A29 TaxID=3160606 RepID=UPI00366C7EE6